MVGRYCATAGGGKGKEEVALEGLERNVVELFIVLLR